MFYKTYLGNKIKKKSLVKIFLWTLIEHFSKSTFLHQIPILNSLEK